MAHPMNLLATATEEMDRLDIPAEGRDELFAALRASVVNSATLLANGIDTDDVEFLDGLDINPWTLISTIIAMVEGLYTSLDRDVKADMLDLIAEIDPDYHAEVVALIAAAEASNDSEETSGE